MSRYSDDGPKWDRCLVSTIKDVAFGGLLGIFLSTLVFKRKRWAFLLGIGYGIGMSYASCDYEINEKSELPPCKKKSEEKKKGGKKEVDIWNMDEK